MGGADQARPWVRFPGETLPSVRELASELSIASNTIVKAYNELQRLGFIESRAGTVAERMRI
ncbi:GntR family transcriptional regulator [Ktedonosporobacter rubrisoli]|uniref:GntR family transcriptional regulator n=1 Tax=Ktedonosporobacter rubrisoli TaxID=2509675 RepID=A0A4P6K574_KTERU|nr:GntR family transcriptional regulator [Ktedonosporobacter rubrisoli]